MKVALGPVKGIIRRGAERRAAWSKRNASIAAWGKEAGNGEVVLVRSVRGAAILA